MKYFIDKWFPVTKIIGNKNGIKKYRWKTYPLYILNFKLRNMLSLFHKHIKNIIAKYGCVLFFLVVIICVLSIIKWNKSIVSIINCSNTPEWLSGIGTVGAATLALYNREHKTSIGLGKVITSNNLSVQVLNRTSSSTFVRLAHIYMNNPAGSPIAISPRLDWRRYYSSYRMWKTLKPYGAYNFYLIKDKNVKPVNKMIKMIRSYEILSHQRVTSISIEIELNDHYYNFTQSINIEQDIYDNFLK